MPRQAGTAQSSTSERRRIPLADEILAAGHLRSKSTKRKFRTDDEGDENGSREHYIDARASKKILQIGQELADEDAEEIQEAAKVDDDGVNAAFNFESRFRAESLSDDDEDDARAQQRHAEDEWGEEEDVEEIELDPDDLHTFHKFMPRGDDDPIFHPKEPDKSNGEQGTNLADLILEKIAAYEANQAGGQQSGGGQQSRPDAVPVPAKAIEVYEKVGFLLSRYKSGPLPKPFKILPTLPYWESLLEITRPETWTPNAIYAATRVFISAKPGVAQEFINAVLLDRVRDDIHETKKLNVHIYDALKKALYKPACFFKGLLFPLVASGTCTLREAHIVSSVISRVSIPVLHSAAALLRLCEIAAEQTSTSVSTEEMGATNIFLRVFLEKKYALPYKVIDALVFHFLRFRAMDPIKARGDDVDMGDSESAAKAYKLPVLWHQSLLAFAQRYRNDITEDQREALLDLLVISGHKDIGPEVRRELLAGRGRGVVVAPESASNGGDDTMDIGV